MEHFKAFKKNVPVMGGILLDQDMQRVLLVKGWKNSACWGFPRGKIHKNETDAQCAVREVSKLPPVVASAALHPAAGTGIHATCRQKKPDWAQNLVRAFCFSWSQPLQCSCAYYNR